MVADRWRDRVADRARAYVVAAEALIMFHVPEGSRLVAHPLLGTTREDGNNGAFVVPSPAPGWELVLICSDGEGWEHVSVHACREQHPGRARTPSWLEMCFVKDVCWDPEDEVVQFHPRRSEYVNVHPHTLHMWRPNDGATLIPRPPRFMV